MALQASGCGCCGSYVCLPHSLPRGAALVGRFRLSSSLVCSSSLHSFINEFVNYGSIGYMYCCVPRVRVGSRRSCGRHKSCQPDPGVDDDGGFERIGDPPESRVKEKSNDDQTAFSPSFGDANPLDNSGVVSACLIGVLTGISVVNFNNTVHAIHEFFWDGVAHQGVSWLREEPIVANWKQIVLVPVCGGLIVSILNTLHDVLEARLTGISLYNLKAALQPVLKAVAACFTLGTGNSLGPEGPSVEIGASVGRGVSALLNRTEKNLAYVSAGSAAGISAGFNAAFAGCFFAVESILWPSPAGSAKSLTNVTSMVILSAVTASVLSEIGLGSEPAFKVPEYDFRSPSELPLYLLLGSLCSLVSLTLSHCTSYMLVIVDNVQKATGIPRALFPVLGGLIVGLLALEYPEILYWGFENVDNLLESQPISGGLSINLLLQLVAVKIVATSVCRASGLVGGYYAPSLFIGAATGMAYGKFWNSAISHSDPNFHVSFLEVASPQAYGLVGMAATLAGVCRVPLTSVLLLFELTQDYRIVLPLLGAVGLSSWISSGKFRNGKVSYSSKLKSESTNTTQRSGLHISRPIGPVPSYLLAAKASNSCNHSHAQTSFISNGSDILTEIEKRICVSQAMMTRYVTVLMSTSVEQSVSLMLNEMQSCAMIVDDESILIGLLKLAGIQKFIESTNLSCQRSKGFVVSDICSVDHRYCEVSGTATPNMTLFSAQIIMKMHNTSQLPVVSALDEGHNGFVVGLLDKRCIGLACRAVAARERLVGLSLEERSSTE